MRTTVALPDATLSRLKRLAAKRGVTLKQMLRTVVERELALSRQAARKKRRMKFPSMPSKEPGTLNLTNAEIEELLT